LTLLLDEDTQSRRLVKLLRGSGHDVLTVNEAELQGQPDPAVLTAAAAAGRVLVTKNCADFQELHALDQTHAGIIAIYQDARPEKCMTYRQVDAALSRLESTVDGLTGEFHILNHYR